MKDIVIGALFGALLIILSIYGSMHWGGGKPPPRYVNTLQRDINP